MVEQQPLVVRLLGAVSGGPDAVVRGLQAVPARLAEQRTRITQQVRVAHWIGEMAVSVGTRELGKRLAALRTPSGPESSAPTPAQPHTRSDGPPNSSKHATPARRPAAPFSGYDDLAAAQVVALLGALPHSELELIRDYEAAHRARRTILNRVDQVLG